MFFAIGCFYSEATMPPNAMVYSGICVHGVTSYEVNGDVVLNALNCKVVALLVEKSAASHKKNCVAFFQVRNLRGIVACLF